MLMKSVSDKTNKEHKIVCSFFFKSISTSTAKDNRNYNFGSKFKQRFTLLCYTNTGFLFHQITMSETTFSKERYSLVFLHLNKSLEKYHFTQITHIRCPKHKCKTTARRLSRAQVSRSNILKQRMSRS